MDSFISELANQGFVESHGIFTLDVSKARVKLAEFQSAQFGEFRKLLVMWAHAAEAREIECETREQMTWKGKAAVTVMKLRGYVLDEQELQLVGFRAFRSDTPIATRFLADLLSCLCSRFSLKVYSGSKECSLSFSVSTDAIERIAPDSEYFEAGTTVLVVDSDLRAFLNSDYQPCGSSDCNHSLSLATF